MKKLPIVLDLETKYLFRDVSRDNKKLGVSVVGVYDYKDNLAKTFLENELNKLFKLLEECSYIIGFNVRSFDLMVLQAYYPGRLSKLPVFDILDYVKGKIGRRLGLNDLAFATLKKKKTGHGLMAVDYYKEGKIDELKKYCLDDVLLTKELFEYGIKHGEIFYLNEVGKMSIKTDWKKYLESSEKRDTDLTLPF
jgi:DEAD/DEAH box helicase domain-containing protein